MLPLHMEHATFTSKLRIAEERRAGASAPTTRCPGKILLQCPACGGGIDGLSCTLCAFEMRVSNGIMIALPPARAAHYARFMEDYAYIREKEGRGSNSERFYLGLPYKDVTGKNSEQWRIRGCSFDHLLQRILRGSSQPGGERILDLGAGNGWMSRRLALAGYEPVAVDLLTNQRDGLGAAAHYRKQLGQLFPRFQAEFSSLPFQSGQFDCVIFNASFHYSGNYEATLREALRCVRMQGMVIISDSPWYSNHASGVRMVAERQAAFLQNYGTPSNAIDSLEFLTDERLRLLEDKFAIRWSVHSPNFGLKWAMRPLVAKMRHRREPSRFRIYVARKET
jgi:SAM-dependent methyltransferase